VWYKAKDMPIWIFGFSMNYRYLVKVVGFDLEKNRIIADKYREIASIDRLTRQGGKSVES
jgi:hypothetical protein